MSKIVLSVTVGRNELSTYFYISYIKVKLPSAMTDLLDENLQHTFSLLKYF